MASATRDESDDEGAQRMTDSTDGMIVLTTTGQDEPDAGRTMAGGGGSDDLVITENPGAGVFEATRDGETVAGVVYSRSGDRVTLLATSVFPAFRGQGIAGMLLSGVLDRLRAEGATATLSLGVSAAASRLRVGAPGQHLLRGSSRRVRRRPDRASDVGFDGAASTRRQEAGKAALARFPARTRHL